jgi:hypothetical protein
LLIRQCRAEGFRFADPHRFEGREKELGARI